MLSKTLPRVARRVAWRRVIISHSVKPLSSHKRMTPGDKAIVFAVSYFGTMGILVTAAVPFYVLTHVFKSCGK
jgi:hypothetical protein